MPIVTRRVLFVGPPTSVHFQRWTTAAVQHGLDVYVTGRARSFQGGGTFIPLPSGIGRVGYALSIPQLARLSRDLRPAVVHAHYATSYGVMAALAIPRLTPIVLTCWGSDILVEPQRNRGMRLLAHIALRRATLVSSMAFHMTERLVALGVPPQRIVTLPFGADLSTFTCGSQRKRETQWDLITTRALEPQYNVHLLLRALATIRDRSGMQPRTAIIGEGAEAQRLRAYAAQLRLDHVRFLGHLGPVAIARELCVSAVFVSLATSDGNNVSLNEAMAAGVLPVTTDNPASREWVTHGVNGLLTQLRTEDIVLHLGRAAVDEDLARRALAINRRLIEECASWSAQARKMFDLYETLVAFDRAA